MAYRVAQGNIDRWSEGEVIEEGEFLALFGEGNEGAAQSRLSQLVEWGFLEQIDSEPLPAPAPVAKETKPKTPPAPAPVVEGDKPETPPAPVA